MPCNKGSELWEPASLLPLREEHLRSNNRERYPLRIDLEPRKHSDCKKASRIPASAGPLTLAIPVQPALLFHVIALRSSSGGTSSVATPIAVDLKGPGRCDEKQAGINQPHRSRTVREQDRCHYKNNLCGSQNVASVVYVRKVAGDQRKQEKRSHLHQADVAQDHGRSGLRVESQPPPPTAFGSRGLRNVPPSRKRKLR